MKPINFITIAVLIVLLWLITKREQPSKPIDANTIKIGVLTNKIKDLKKEVTRKKIDTLIVTKKVYKTKYDTILIEVIHNAPDTCTTYLLALDKACKQKDSINNELMVEYETQIGKYSEIVGLNEERFATSETRHKSDSLKINKLEKKLKRTRTLASIGIGAALIGGILIAK